MPFTTFLNSYRRNPSAPAPEDQRAAPSPIVKRARAAAEEPLKNLKESYTFWRAAGSMFVCLARPKRAISQFFASCLRKGWEKAGMDAAMHTTVAKGCNVVISLKWLSGKEANWVTAKDVADWRVPTPVPRTLCEARRVAEQLGVPSMIAKGGKVALALTNGAYRKLYGEAFLELPALSPDIANVFLGIDSNRPFSDRVDEFFLASIRSNPNIVEEQAQRNWASNYPVINIVGFVYSDVTRLNTNLYQAVGEACRQTLQETATERRAFIQALEGVALSVLYRKIADQMPGKEVFIRETVLYVLQNYFSFFSGCGFGVMNYFFPEHLQKAIDSLPTKPLELAKTVSNLDFVDSAANALGGFVETGLSSEYAAASIAVGGAIAGKPLEGAALATTMSIGSKVAGRVAKEAFSFGATKGLEFGPAAVVVIYRLLYEELDKLASKGNQRRNDFSFLNLLWGNAPEPRAAGPVDPNADYLTPIASEFVLGTLNRLCEGNGLMSVLYEVFGEMTKEKAAENGPSSSEPLPGVAELKTALEAFVTTLKAKLTATLGTRVRTVFEEEGKRQRENAAQVSDAIATAQESIHLRNATSIANALSPVVALDPKTVYKVLSFNPFDYFNKERGQ